MEKRLRNILQQRFAESLVGKELICLNVPDEFQFQQPELVVLLTEKLAPHLGPPNIDDIPDATPDSPSRKMRDGNDRDRGDSVAGFRGGATNGDAFSLTNLNLNLNPGGIIGGFSGAVFGFLTLGPNFKAGMTQLILICIVGGAFAGNLLWRLLFGQPKSDRETEDNIE